MKIPLAFAELHAPLFLAGKNFGMKLDDKKHKGIKLEFDKDEGLLIIGWSNQDGLHEGWVPLANVASMTPAGAPKKTATEKLVAATTPAPDMARGKLSAQVETPQAHVHAGPGAGLTGQEKKKVVL